MSMTGAGSIRLASTRAAPQPKAPLGAASSGTVLCPPEGTSATETLVSWLVSYDGLVLKAKKPVRLAFLDLSCTAARRRASEEEVALNRRLAPDVYLGVGSLSVPGRPREPLVVMRRLPAGRSLARLAVEGAEALGAQLDAVAQVLAEFHARVSESPSASARGGVEAVCELWRTSLDEVARFEGSLVLPERLAAIRAEADRYLSGRAELFEERVAAGRIRDGHGDLLADDIFCLDDGPRLLDCLEFDSDLRQGDVVSDVASLAMDLERLGRADLADRLLASSPRHRPSGDECPGCGPRLAGPSARARVL